ncbi:MAG: hypothetical protein JRF63_07870 [Deltaproteobacteria bacterium]|nr:hypothetical protein [Deltaproteobacteria bacterium]
MSGPNDSDDRFVELVKIASSIEADLLAVYLDDCGLEFQMLDHTRAPVLASMLPQAQRPVTFRVRLADLVQARKLVVEYKDLQSAELLPSDPPPSPAED